MMTEREMNEMLVGHALRREEELTALRDEVARIDGQRRAAYVSGDDPEWNRLWYIGAALTERVSKLQGHVAEAAAPWFALAEQNVAFSDSGPAHECGEACPHDSDCALHNAPALPIGPCNCSRSRLAGNSQGGDK